MGRKRKTAKEEQTLEEKYNFYYGGEGTTAF